MDADDKISLSVIQFSYFYHFLHQTG